MSLNLDRKVIEAAGGTAKNLKKLFTTGKGILPNKKIQPLIDSQRSRIDEGIRRNLDQARHYWAIDQAYDAVLRQETPTIMQGLIDRNPGPGEVEALAKSYGLTNMLLPLTNAKGEPLDVDGKPLKNSNAKPGYKLNTRIFYEVYVPLVLSYLKHRWSKLWSEVDLIPLYKYSPNVLNATDRAIAKVVTNRVQRIAVDTNCRAAERESILRMLLHGKCVNFPVEQWWKDEQKIGNKVKVIREGIRYEIPHASRVFHDLTNPLWTVNSDTGCEYAGYWTIVRARDIYNNPEYWNNSQLEITAAGWRRSTAWGAYQNMYPCTACFPSFQTASDNDRQVEAFQYTTDHLNNGIDLTVYFEKLIPSQVGLYNYDYPLWHRFVYAGDRNIIHCEPFFYTPPIAYLYDHDGGRLFNSSLAQELLPYQDQLGNLLTQYLYTVRKNLLRIVGVNRDGVGKDFINKIKNATENAVRGTEWFEYSATELRGQGVDFAQLFSPMPVTVQNSAELITSINMVLNILERALGYSPQEVGAAASHEQSATEVGITSAATGTRLKLTASFRDDAILARKRAIYYGMMHWGDDATLVEVTDLTPHAKEVLVKAGFKVQDVDGEPGVATVSGSKKSMVMDQIVSEREGANRINDAALAQLLLTFIDRMLQNPALAQMVGAEQVSKIFNAAGELLGLPSESMLDIGMINERQKELKKLLESAQNAQGGGPGGPADNAVASQQEVAQALQAVLAQVQQALAAQEQKIGEVITPIVQKTQELEQAVVQVGTAQAQTGQAVGAVATQLQQVEEAIKVIIATISGQGINQPVPVAPAPAAVVTPVAGPPIEAVPTGPLA